MYKYPPLNENEKDYLNLIHFNGMTWKEIGKAVGIKHHVVYKSFIGMTNPYPNNRRKIESFVKKAKETGLMEKLTKNQNAYRNGKIVPGVPPLKSNCSKPILWEFKFKVVDFLKKIRFPYNNYRCTGSKYGGFVRIITRIGNKHEETIVYLRESWKSAKSYLKKRSQELIVMDTDVEDYLTGLK